MQKFSSTKSVAFNIYGMDVRIKGSKLHGKDVHVMFSADHDPDFYWTHSTTEIGSEKDEERNPTFTAWGWIKHLRHKVWWTPQLETGFLRECKKHLQHG